MVYIPPPQLAGNRTSYSDAYNQILSAHRRSPLSSASSVIMVVSPNVDALCASRMLATLFKQDDVGYRIIPVSGRAEMENVRDELSSNNDLHTLILINMGGRYDLPLAQWFGNFDLKVTIHVIDSARPYGLVNLFMAGENADRILVWDDGDADKLIEEKKSWEALEYELKPESDSEDDDDLDDNEQDEDLSDDKEDTGSASSPSSKRRIRSEDPPRKRRRTDDEQKTRMTWDELDHHELVVNKYFTSGTWHGQCAASTIYILVTQLERADNDLLWLAILGLTFQYITSRIPRDIYEGYHSIYLDEVSRLNPQPQKENNHSLIAINPDDISVRSTEELRFMLFRHWTLYDAMFHSSYVASKLGIWKERGRQRLTGLLAKMGFSIPQTQQPFAHMDMDLKKNLIQKLNDIAPEYGLVELSYPSFMRCYGFHSQPLSAADAVEGISVLLDVAEGIRMEVEIEGTRNGGEWFGGGRIWELPSSDKAGLKLQEKPVAANPADPTAGHAGNENDADKDEERKKEPHWWVKNFWTAYDALSDISALRQSLRLSMSLHRAIIRQGTSIIDKQDIKTMRSHRVVVLTQGPDLILFSHPSILTRLALWLVDALRDRLADATTTRLRRKGLPFVVACLNETTQRFTVVGITAASEFGDVRKNNFATTFFLASQKCQPGRAEFTSFDAAILEVEKSDLHVFLQELCNA
ncbi:unnamed protein product [Cyclocybe aegerita]|uniref:CDC45-like protein n=1 Tax=Cyclocybe aegerita TaxID=1973307 RepID=A0A8S0VSY1_CYCAE|nr:unnamed protein product [Cyclocybe aegerita]